LLYRGIFGLYPCVADIAQCGISNQPEDDKPQAAVPGFIFNGQQKQGADDSGRYKDTGPEGGDIAEQLLQT